MQPLRLSISITKKKKFFVFVLAKLIKTESYLGKRKLKNKLIIIKNEE